MPNPRKRAGDFGRIFWSITLQYLMQHRSITNSQYRDLTDATERTASLDLKKMADLGFITRQGKGRDVSYRLNTTGNPQ